MGQGGEVRRDLVRLFGSALLFWLGLTLLLPTLPLYLDEVMGASDQQIGWVAVSYTHLTLPTTPYV